MAEILYDPRRSMACFTDGNRPFGYLFTGPECFDQAEAFRDWVKTSQLYPTLTGEILGPGMRPRWGRGGKDVADWGDLALERLRVLWQNEALDENGRLKEGTA